MTFLRIVIPLYLLFGMIFSENRYPLFRIMLWRIRVSRQRQLPSPSAHAAIATRDVDFNRAGLPPGGPVGRGSSDESASRTSSILTFRCEPGSSRRAGLDAT